MVDLLIGCGYDRYWCARFIGHGVRKSVCISIALWTKLDFINIATHRHMKIKKFSVHFIIKNIFDRKCM